MAKRAAGNGDLFEDWKRFCAVLREIANGANGRPLSGFEAQRRAQLALTERGYAWLGKIRRGLDKPT